MAVMKIFTFDTTLRDGTQGESVSFSVDDKLIIAQKLDELGIDYIEGGWPGSNPKDKEFFARARELKLQHARLTAFGSTRFAKNPVEEDRNVRALVEAGTPVVSIFGKTWDLHVQRALGITLDENLELISETVSYLKDHGKEVVYDAEHFFDGYCGQSGLRAAHARSRAQGRRRCALPVRHQRRHAHRPAGRNRGRSAPAVRRRHRHPHAQRFGRGRGQHAWPRSRPAPPTCRAA